MHKFMCRPLERKGNLFKDMEYHRLANHLRRHGKREGTNGSAGGCEAHSLGTCSLLSLASSQQSLLPPQAKGKGCTTSLVHPWRGDQGSQGGKLGVFRGRQVTEGNTPGHLGPAPSWRVCAHPEAWVPSLHKTHLLGKSLLKPPV